MAAREDVAGGIAARAAFVAWLSVLRPAIEATLDGILPAAAAPPAVLHEAMRYSVLAPGKRIRPALTVLAGEAIGGSREALLPAAAALELIHTYSLIHDDLPALDDDDLRRGRPTLHRRYDEATAILAGDALLTLGLTVLASEPAAAGSEARRRAVELVGTAIGTGGMIGGQVEDLAAEREWPADPARALERIHRGKTASLLVAALRLGGVHGAPSVPPSAAPPASAPAVADPLDARLLALGARLGLMFQVADDILDVEGSAAQLGKSAGKDARAKKLTFPGLYGLEESRRRLAALREEALAIAAELPGQAVLWVGLVEYLARRES